MGKHQKRTYRQRVRHPQLTAFRVAVRETDVLVQAERRLSEKTRDLILAYRGQIEHYSKQFPGFQTTLAPWMVSGPMPGIVRDMAVAGLAAGVGPMAAVAGAIAERVGRRLLADSAQVIIENGGDVFIKAASPVTVALYAARSPFSMRLGVRIDSREKALCVCTSSGTVGHSLSLGSADAVCVISPSGSLADASATALANRVKAESDIQATIEKAREMTGVLGLIIIKDSKIGMWGGIEIVPLAGKKG